MGNRYISGAFLFAALCISGVYGRYTDRHKRSEESKMHAFANILAKRWRDGNGYSSGAEMELSPDDVSNVMTKYEGYPKLVDSIINGGKIDGSLLNSVPPSLLFLIPNDIFLKTVPDPSGQTLSGYVNNLPQSYSAALLASSALLHGNRTDKIEFLASLSGLSPISLEFLSESVSKVWWKEESSSSIVNQLLNSSSTELLKRLPLEIVAGVDSTVDFTLVFPRGDVWKGIPRAHICIWMDPVKKSVKVLEEAYGSLHSSDEEDYGEFLTLLRCFSPKALTDWKAESTRVSNNKSPILEMILKAEEFRLNPLQVRELTNCIDWADPSLVERRKVFHMLDTSQIDSKDLKDLDETFFRQFKTPWDLVLKVSKLKFQDVPQESLSEQLLLKMGPFYSTLPLLKSPNVIDSYSLAAVDSVYSPWIRFSQARNLVKYLENDLALQSKLAFALPSTRILEWPDSKMVEVNQIYKMTPTQKWALAQNILHNRDFVSYYSEIIDWIHPEADPQLLKQFPIGQISESQALKMFENDWRNSSSPMSADYINEEFKRIIPGLTCSNLFQSSVLDLPIIASYYNEYIRNVAPKKYPVFSPSLRYCFADRLKEYLKIKAMLYGLKDINFWNTLTRSDIKSVGGYILSALNPSEVESFSNVDNQQIVVEEIGRVPLADLMPTVSYEHMKKWASIGHKRKRINFSDMMKLGSLTFFLSKDILSTAHPFDIRSFVRYGLSGEPRKKLLCLKRKDRLVVSEILMKGFSPALSWNAWDLVHMGDLLINVPSNVLLSVYPNSFRNALPQILEMSQLHDMYDQFPKFNHGASYSEACASWLKDPEEGKLFKKSFGSLMRFYLAVAQYSVKVADREYKETLPPPHLRSRKALKEKLFEIYQRINLIVSSKGFDENKRAYLKRVLSDINREKDTVILDILDEDPKRDVNATTLYKEYRSKPDKVAAKSDALEDLLIDIQKHVIREIKYLYNLSGEEIAPQYSEGVFCSLVGCMDKDWCAMFECQVEKPKELRLGLTCNGLIAAGKAGVALEVRDLENWSEEQITECLDVLGEIPWRSRKKKMAILKAIEGQIDLKNPDELLSLGSLLEVVDLNELEFTDHNVDALSKIGQYPRKTVSSGVKERLRQFILEAKDDFEILELRKVSLGHLICFLDENEEEKNEIAPLLFGHLLDSVPLKGDERTEGLKTYDFNRLSILKHIYRCENEKFRKRVSDEVLHYYGDSVENLAPSDILSLGLFISSLDPKVLAKLPEHNFESIPPSGAVYMKKSQLLEIPVEKLSRMRPETLSMFKESHIPEAFPLSAQQLNDLRRNKIEAPVVEESVPEVAAEPSSLAGSSFSASVSVIILTSLFSKILI